MPGIADLGSASSVAITDNLVVNQAGTDRKVTADKFAIVSQRANGTINANWANYIELTPAVASYSPQTFLLSISAWTSVGNPFDFQLWLLSGAGGIYTATKIAGSASNMIVTITSGKIRISNQHASTNAVTYVELIQIRA